MNSPTNAREILIAEALGDIVRLLDRVEAITATLETTRREMVSTGADLTQRLDAIEGRIQAMARNAAIGLVHRLAQQASEALHTAVAGESRVIADRMRQAFGEQLESLLVRVSSLSDELRRFNRHWETWLTHLATAIISGLLTWSLTVAWATR